LGLTLENAIIAGPIDWNHGHFLVSVTLRGCIFKGPISARGLHVEGDFSLEGSTVDRVNLQGARIDGNLDLLRVRTTGSAQTDQVRDDSEPGLDLESNQGGDSVDLEAGEVRLDDSTPGLDLNSIRVAGSVDLDGAEVQGEVRLIGAVIGGDLACRGAKVHNENGDAFSADGAKIAGGVYLFGKFEAWGQVRLPRAVIGVDLTCRGSKLHNEYRTALFADGIQVAGNMVLTKGFEAWGSVRLCGAEIKGQLNCRGAKLHNENRDALLAEGVQVAGSMVLTKGFEAWGSVRLCGAEIKGQLNCCGAKLHNENRDALNAQRIQVTESIFLTKGFVAWGEVCLLGARIGGDLVCRGSKLHNEKGDAICGDGSKISGAVVLDEGFQAWGTVRLPSAEIEGQLNCSGATFHNEDSDSLRLDLAKIGGDVVLNKHPKGFPFLACGTVGFDQAEIRGSFFCAGARFDAARGDALIARDMTVRNRFQWQLATPANGRVLLSGAKVGELNDDIECWPTERGSLDLTNFVYAQFGEDAAKVGAKRRVEWIRVQTGAPGAYKPQPYVQLAQVFKAGGHDDEWRKVMIAKQDDLRIFGTLPGPQKVWNRLIGLTIGHGYRPWRAAYAILFLYVVSVLLVLGAKENNAFVAVGSTAANQVQKLKPSVCTNTYPCLSAFAYPVDAALPLINLHELDSWQFNANNGWGQAGRDWTVFATVTGWGLATMLVVGLSSLVRDR